MDYFPDKLRFVLASSPITQLTGFCKVFVGKTTDDQSIVVRFDGLNVTSILRLETRTLPQLTQHVSE